VKRETGVAFAYPRQHGDPYVFPTGVAEQEQLQDPVVRQPDPTEVLVVDPFVHQGEAAGAPGGS
jgi:hypothetical protein